MALQSEDPQKLSESVESQEDKNRQVSFAENLWGSLDAIKDNAKKGANIMEGVLNFVKSFHRNYNIFTIGMYKALEVFEREMLKYNSLDTTTICMSSL